ncbi:MAG: hypothetical protein ACRED1_12600 [Limisphaerales bacterium]
MTLTIPHEPRAREDLKTSIFAKKSMLIAILSIVPPSVTCKIDQTRFS